jgi:hypothetical protein
MAELYDPVVFVGGFCDGLEMAVPTGTHRWRMAVPMPFVFDSDPGPDDDLHPLRTVEYRVRLDHGWPSRLDDGRVVFEVYG